MWQNKSKKQCFQQDLQLSANSGKVLSMAGEKCIVVDIGREEQSPDDTKLMTIGTSSEKAPCTGPNSKSLQTLHQQSAKMDFKVLNVVWGFILR